MMKKHKKIPNFMFTFRGDNAEKIRAFLKAWKDIDAELVFLPHRKVTLKNINIKLKGGKKHDKRNR